MYRDQKIFVIERDGKYYSGGGSAWLDDVELAAVYPYQIGQRKIKIDIGMEAKLVEVIPTLKN